jgi:hypothetical protein
VSRGHGRIQRRVVELLSADERARGEGLPLSALRPVLGPDRSNARRAIRSLIRRGDAEWVTDPETGERRLKLEFWLCVAAMMNREEAERDGRRRPGPQGCRRPPSGAPQATPGAGEPHG